MVRRGDKETSRGKVSGVPIFNSLVVNSEQALVGCERLLKLVYMIMNACLL